MKPNNSFFTKYFPTIFGGAKALSENNKERDFTTGWSTVNSSDGSRINAGNLMEANKNWVFVAVKKVAENVALAGIKLNKYNKKGEDEEVYDHPALQLMYKPNPYMTGATFITVTWAHIELTGNAYWKVEKVGKRVVSLFPMNPQGMKVVWNDERTAVLRFEYTVGAKKFTYLPEQIFHLKTSDVGNPLTGKGTLEGVAEWVDVDNYITEFNRRFFINGANFGSAIETDSTSTATLDTLRSQVQDVYTGVKNAFKTYILPKGSKFVESTKTMKDMDMSEGDNRYRDKILSAFGVPKSVLGVTEAGSSRADAEAKNYAFQEFTIKPKLIMLTEYLTEFFLPIVSPADVNKYYFTFNNPTPESKEQQLNEDKTALNSSAYMTVNEVRGKRGLPPIEGGDVLPSAKPNIDPYAADPVAPVKSNFNNPFKKKRVEFTTADSFAEKLADIAVSKIKEAVVVETPEEKPVDERRKAFEPEHKMFVKRVSGFEDKLKLSFQQHDKNQQARVITNLLKFLTNTKGVEQKAITKADILDANYEVGAVIDFATPLLGELWKDQALIAISKITTDAVFAFNDVSKRILQASVSRMAKKYTRTTLALLTTELNEGLKNGDSLDQLTKRVQGVYGLSEEYRAARVARTETFSVANDASRDAFRQSGVVKSIEWYTAEDELVCEYCGPMDGKVVSIEQSFFAKGDTVEGAEGGTMTLDYEKVQNPPLHANCRCEIKAKEISIKGAIDPEIKELTEMLAELETYE